MKIGKTARARWLIILFLLFVIGAVYRIFFLKLYPQAGVFDQVQYDTYAKEILTFGLYANSFRTYGYPIFIAFFYKLFGIGSSVFGIYIWQFVQVGMDSLTALFLFIIAQKLFGSKKIAVVASALYAINPYTAAYAGVMLPDVYTAFLFALLFVVIVWKNRLQRMIFVAVISLLLGYIPQVKPMYLPYSVAMLPFFSCFLVRKTKRFSAKLTTVTMILIFWTIPTLYTIKGNLEWFKEFSIMDVDKLFIENFYISLFNAQEGENGSGIYAFHEEVRWAYETYSFNSNDRQRQHEIQKLFLKKSFQEIARDPVNFISWRVKKMWFVWEKREIFPFANPKDPRIETGLHWGNRLFILLALVGFVTWARSVMRTTGAVEAKWWIVFFSLPVIFTSLGGAVTTAEHRYSLPAYPMVALFAAIGSWILAKTVHIKLSETRKLVKTKRLNLI